MLAGPSIYETQEEVGRCDFYVPYPSDAPKLKRSDIFVNLPPSTGPELRDWAYSAGRVRGWAAVRASLDRHWFVADAIFAHQESDTIYVECNTSIACDAVAVSIDPRMTREDIEGATRIFKNADNTGWLFAHSNTGHHADHELQLMACIDGVFQPYFRQLHVDVIDGANRNIKQRATRLYSLLSQFYGEVIALARTNARAVLLGHRHREAHPAEGHLHSEIKTAFDAVRAKWIKTRKSEATDLTPAFTYVGNILTIPNPESRWDRAARLEAEAKKKKAAAEAEASTQTPTPTESSGE